jgi:hypothetical protein
MYYVLFFLALQHNDIKPINQLDVDKGGILDMLT